VLPTSILFAGSRQQEMLLCQYRSCNRIVSLQLCCQAYQYIPILGAITRDILSRKSGARQIFLPSMCDQKRGNVISTTVISTNAKKMQRTGF
jgi:hypothetical protein